MVSAKVPPLHEMLLLLCSQGSSVVADSGTECCLSLCQAVSFLPTPDEDDDTMTMMRKDDALGRGENTHTETHTPGRSMNHSRCHILRKAKTAEITNTVEYSYE